MFLTYETVHGESAFGFYKSKEGREFLRQLFKHYLRRQNLGEGKVATIIADSFAQSEKQEREVDRTKSALRRWSRDGQGELWPKDQNKNLRSLRRLENEYLSVTEIREVLQDTAETIQKHQSGIALSNFFYGASKIEQINEDIDQIQSSFCGLYDVKELSNQDHSDPYEEEKKDIVEKLIAEVRKRGVDRNVIQIDPSHFDFETKAFIDTRETPSYQIDHSSSARFIRLNRVKGRSFMVMQSFEVKLDDEDIPRPRRLSTGYAFPMKNGTLHALLTESGPSSDRSYFAYSPNELVRPYGHCINEGDCLWKVTRQPFAKVYEAFVHEKKFEIWEKITDANRHLTYFDVDKLSAQLDKTIWNFLP
ncbi:MAG: hypothetical protein R3D56_11675 [Paracoccaceae bacterium]